MEDSLSDMYEAADGGGPTAIFFGSDRRSPDPPTVPKAWVPCDRGATIKLGVYGLGMPNNKPTKTVSPAERRRSQLKNMRLALVGCLSKVQMMDLDVELLLPLTTALTVLDERYPEAKVEAVQ